MKRLTLIGDINGFTGYGMHAIQIVRDLEAMTGVYISIRAASRCEAFGATIPKDIVKRLVTGVQPEPWELLLHPPNFKPTPGKQTAYFTMHETTKLPAMGPHLLNAADVVIVPCQFNADTFSACGVTKPIRVVPLGINTEAFNWKPFPVDDRCVFGAAGRMAHGGVRKGLVDVVYAFKRAFGRKVKDVALKVKCYPDCPVAKADTKDPRIEIMPAHLPEEALAQWFESLTCFVSVARGEGWGLMQQQAMATGRPLLSPKFGGVREFFDETCGFVLPHKLEPAKAAYEGQGHWAEVSDDDLISAMRLVYNRQSFMPEIGAQAAKRAAMFSWRASNEQLVSVLQEFGAL